jgi:hypothetical protein
MSWPMCYPCLGHLCYLCLGTAQLPSPTDVDPWFKDPDEQTFRLWLGDMPVPG